MAKTAEGLGFDSIWYAEHPAVPVESNSPFPSTGGEIPWTYSHFTDPYIALARASAVTTTLKLGTGITLIPQRNPLILAKQVAALDFHSGGRFLLGIGTYPPIIIGGAAKNVLQRIVDHADGWLPNRLKPPELKTSRAELDRLATEAGRDPKSISIIMYGQEPKKSVVQPLLDAGANSVVVRLTHVDTEAEMGAQMEQVAGELL
mgnify:CR=1 FL=1